MKIAGLFDYFVAVGEVLTVVLVPAIRCCVVQADGLETDLDHEMNV